jgi:hypothetical protein
MPLDRARNRLLRSAVRPAQAGAESGFEAGRTQMMGDGGEAQVEGGGQADEAADVVGEGRPGRPAAQAVQMQAQRRELLAAFVVEVLGEAPALLLLRAVQLGVLYGEGHDIHIVRGWGRGVCQVDDRRPPSIGR